MDHGLLVRNCAPAGASGNARMPALTQRNPANMKDISWLDELAERISQGLARGGEVTAELRTTVKQLLRSGMSNLNILTREEFDAQVRALQRAEQRIAELEEELQALETRLGEPASSRKSRSK